MQVYIGTLLLTGLNCAPQGWAVCDGSLLSIAEYSALFNLLGTTYGGDGQNTFGLPDLRGRVPVGAGQLVGGSNYAMGQAGGVEQVSIGLPQYPVHTHPFIGSNASAGTGQPSNAILASGQQIYSSNGNPNEILSPNACTMSSGGDQVHENRQPYLAMSWIISLYGIYPSQS